MSKLIVTVCKGNVHRSVVAAFCLNRELQSLGLGDQVECVSRGLTITLPSGEPKGKNIYEYPEALALTGPVLEELGIVIPRDQSATLIDPEIVEKADLIFAMDEGVLRDSSNALATQFPLFVYKMHLYDELVGETRGIMDCGQSKDAALHRSINCRIDEIAKEGLDKLLQLLSIASS